MVSVENPLRNQVFSSTTLRLVELDTISSVNKNESFTCMITIIFSHHFTGNAKPTTSNILEMVYLVLHWCVISLWMI